MSSEIVVICCCILLLFRQYWLSFHKISLSMLCRSLFVFLYFFPLAIVLSILLRYMDSDYLFDFFNFFLNNTTYLVQVQFLENVTRQHYFLSLPVLFFTDFKENDVKFTTTSESLGKFMIINFNFMNVHVYLSQWILVSNDIMHFIMKIFTITSITYNNLVLVKLFKTETQCLESVTLSAI
jgi:hypothetical protein